MAGGWARWFRAARSTEQERAALRRLLSADELPGTGWKVQTEYAHTGDGEIVASRTYSCASARRWVTVQVATASDPAPATERFDRTRQLAPQAMAGEYHVVQEQDVAPPEIIGVQRAWAHEAHVTGHGADSVILLLACAAGPSTILVSASGSGARWWWHELGALAEQQAAALITRS